MGNRYYDDNYLVVIHFMVFCINRLEKLQRTDCADGQVILLLSEWEQITRNVLNLILVCDLLLKVSKKFKM